MSRRFRQRSFQQQQPMAQLSMLHQRTPPHSPQSNQLFPSTFHPADASWDILLNNSGQEEEKKEDSRSVNYNLFPTSTPNHKTSLQKSSASNVSGGTSGRVSRLRSLFQNNNITNRQNAMTPAPSSPACSSGSSAYVGWPGTQDKTGKTVQSNSYDDSSASASFRKYELEKAEHQVSQLTAQTSAMTMEDDYSVESFPSPIRATSSPKRLINTSALSVDDDTPVSEAEFHVAAAIADANATAAARRGESLSAMKYDAERRNHSISFESEDDFLRQPVPLTRNKASSSASRLRSFSNPRIDTNDNHDLHDNDLSPGAEAVRFGKALSTSGSSSCSGGSRSASSSAYMINTIEKRIGYPDLHHESPNYGSPAFPRIETFSPYADDRNTKVPTESALKFNDQFNPPHRNFATPTSKGFRGLIDKTKEVPCLMDNFDSDSFSSKATSAVSSGPSNAGGRPHRHSGRETDSSRTPDEDNGTVSDVFDGITVTESDVFDDLSYSEGRNSTPRQPKQRVTYPERIVEEEESQLNTSFETPSPHDDLKVVLLGGGLTTIQTTADDYQRRRTASDYDGTLTNSDISSNGYTRLPGFHKMLASGTSRDNSLHGIHGNLGARPRPLVQEDNYYEEENYEQESNCTQSETSYESERSSLFSDPYRSDEGFEVHGDLSEYYISSSLMKKVISKYRNISERQSSKLDFAQNEIEEDECKAFALFEMRARIMVKDIERGLERRGGTSVVDDIVTTAYNRAAQRVRDAVIVSKAWRDGATVSDVMNSALLTIRAERTHYVKRPVHDPRTYRRRFTWEAVNWLDDTDFAQFRCPSLGARHMRGVEIFTVGDCQSMLLKLTHERCEELRTELNEATANQLHAEDLLKRERDNFNGEMTEAEMIYLAYMEEVKTISKKLVCAERSFSLVRDRIQKLISRYEIMLKKIETDSFAGASSIFTNESSYCSDYANSDYWEEEENIWERRAKRAEVQAEIAVREALLAKEEARAIREEKMREIQILEKKLYELRSESAGSVLIKEKSDVVKRVTFSANTKEGAPSSIHSSSVMSKEKVDGIKQRFRDRMAATRRQQRELVTDSNRAPLHPSMKKSITSDPQVEAERELLRSAGEEMYQQMDFYERSLQAVDNKLRY